MEATLQSEAEQLVISALQKTCQKNEKPNPASRFELLTQLNEEFPSTATELIFLTAKARAEGQPLQHLTGFQVFVDHEYEVSPAVLIPRPETEVLFSEARALLLQGEEPRLGIEVGLGSGILSIELLANFKSLQMVSTEYSAPAREVAFRNAGKILGTAASQLQILTPSSSLEVLEPALRHLNGKKVDFIISNPPYLSGAQEAEQSVVEHEPREALFAPHGDPNYFYRMLEAQSPSVLNPGGWLFLEIPHERFQVIWDLFRTKTCWESKILLDLTGRERVLIARLQ